MTDRSSLQALTEDLEALATRRDLDAPHGKLLRERIAQLEKDRYEEALEAFGTFFPPRLVRASKERNCTVFFGAGVSAEAGIPLWWDLLSTLGISQDFASEPELKNDPLTAAEVLAYQLGMPKLDEELRASISHAKTPTASHFLLAKAYQDIYITTNYDCLLEHAWKKLYGVAPRVVTTDTDLADIDLTAGKLDGAPIIFKLHGSVDRDAEELVLTRSQYRRHYRTNRKLFDQVRLCLSDSHTLFVGFGHGDPEITRLVEDVIHSFELQGNKKLRPAFYSLQFDMGKRTPEIFAARGIVALRPDISLQAADELDPRTLALTRSLVDLLGAIDSKAHESLDLDDDLETALSSLETATDDGIEALQPLASQLASQKPPLSVDLATLAGFGQSLGELAGQGLYVLNAASEVVESWQPEGLTNPARQTPDLTRRPYVRQARMYREAFISTSDASTFNGNATSFLCVPILDAEGKYRGLIFSAFQVGDWKLPLRLQEATQANHPGREVSFLLIDSHGVLLIPPNREFEVRTAATDGERESANVGFEFERLKRLSRRDKLVERIWNNIVPLSQDDDVLPLGDVNMYSVVAEVPRARWKLALSIPTHT